MGDDGRDSSVDVPGTAAGQAGVNGARGRVLVVDDDEAVRLALSSILDAVGFTVEAAGGGREGLALIAVRGFDAVVSDIRMPDMDGLRLLKSIRERDLDLPVVLLTGGPDVETAAWAVEYGAYRYLLKPVPARELAATLERAVNLGRVARWKREALGHVGVDDLALGDLATLEGRFARALASLWLAGQPIVRASDGSVFATEILVRSHEPRLETPAALFAAAERLALQEDLGRAIRALAARIFLPPHTLLFVNISPTDLLSEDLVYGTAPLTRRAATVVLEVTERVALEWVPDLRRRVARLRSLGYRIAIDDLGAGYSGLTSFASLEPDVAKLDLTIVRGVDRDQTRRRLVASMVQLCRELNIRLVAEGVETVGERDTLTELGCELLQGFLFGLPVAVGDESPAGRG